MHFEFGDDYDEFLDAQRKNQRSKIKDPELDTCVYLDTSEWFNLAEEEGRNGAACNILALHRWHEKRLKRKMKTLAS